MSRPIVRHMLDRRIGFDAAAMAGTTTTFLVPTGPTSGRIVTVDGTEVWIPPRPSIASRRPSVRSRGSCRGSLIDPGDNREIVFESKLEAGFAAILLTRRDVVRVVDQPPAVVYRTQDGKSHGHTFDFLATHADGTRTAYAVKPRAKVKKSGIREVVALIRGQVGRSFADRYEVVTEREITRNRVADAKLVLRARRCRNDGDVTRIRDLVSTLHGTVRLADLVSRSGLGARGFGALVCLVGEGVFETVDGARIDYRTDVRRSARP